MEITMQNIKYLEVRRRVGMLTEARPNPKDRTITPVNQYTLYVGFYNDEELVAYGPAPYESVEGYLQRLLWDLKYLKDLESSVTAGSLLEQQ